MNDFWDEMSRPCPDEVVISGIAVRAGSRVLLRPKRRGADIMDLALAGRTAVVESLEHDEDGRVHVAVTIDDDPGRDLGEARQPGHRFFFSTEEIEPLPDAVEGSAPAKRVLIAGIGNVFLGDDGFGVHVARKLGERPLPAGVVVADYGIRGMDLAYALSDFDAAILVDAVPRGERPGTVYLIDAEPNGAAPVGLDTHGMDPVKVLGLARVLGRVPAQVLVVGCEPGHLPDIDAGEIDGELSGPVRAALDEAVALIESLLDPLRAMDASSAGPGVEAPHPTP